MMQRDMEIGMVVPHPQVVDKNGRDTLGARDPSRSPDHPAEGPSTRKISSHNFWL